MYAAFHSVGLPKRPLTEVIRAVREAGYAGIELNAETLPWAAAHITPETSKEERAAVIATLEQARLKVAAVGAHMPMLHPDEGRRRAAVAFVNGCSDLAVEVGTGYVHILSGPLAAGTAHAEAWTWFVDAVGEIVEHAASLNVTVGIEAIAGHLFHCADDYAKLAADLPGVPFKVNFDPSQIAVQGSSPFEIVDRFADRIVHVHMKDGSGLYPDFAFPPLGQGVIDFDRLIAQLRAAGYDGALSVEYEAQAFGYALSEQQILDESRAFLARFDV
jgi:sugar phosphate isomerase/epimerase